MRKLALLLLILPAFARAQDVARGKAMAELWCANCHVVTSSATIGSANGLQTFPDWPPIPRSQSRSCGQR